MEETTRKNRFCHVTKVKRLALALVLLSAAVGICTGIWRLDASAANMTYAKYNGVDYASVILQDSSMDSRRYDALLKAQQMVTVQWTSPVTFASWLNSNGTYSTTRATDGTASTGSFLAGKTYVGIPYSMANHSADDLKWMNKITGNVSAASLNTYYHYSSTKPTTAYGADCSYFVYQALKAANTSYPFTYKTTSGIPSSGYYTKIAACSSYSSSTVDQLFAQIKPGDIALKSGHVMLYVGRSGSQFAFFEAAAPVTRYVTYNLTHMINNGYTFYRFNGFEDNASSGNDNPYGYVSGAYQVYTSTGETLNIRGGDGVNYPILGEIPDLTKVIVTEIKGYWGKTTYQGTTGWISLLYCRYIGSDSCDFRSWIDFPLQNSTVSGNAIYLQGWALDKHGVSRVTYSINGGAETEMNLSSRPDVAAAYPAYPAQNNSWAASIPLSACREGSNTILIKAYCSTGTVYAAGTRTVTVPSTADTQGPVITDIKVTNQSASGYTVTCTVTDESGVAQVYFPTWTADNGQDDIIWGVGTISGNKVTYRVNRSEHNNETRNYCTHIYAYDSHGNVGFQALPEMIMLTDAS